MAVGSEQQKARPAARGSSKVQPGLTRKKLPWLDGKSSIASSPVVTPPENPPAHKREVSISPLSRQPTDASMGVVSEPQARPSGVVRKIKESKSHRASAARSLPTPIGLSIVNVEEPDIFVEARLRSDSLAPVPDHLEPVETPNSPLHTVQRNVYASPPRIIQTVQRSPNQPVPRPSIFERHSQRRLSNAIEGLEELVEEAVVTAEHSERPEHVDKIYAIIENASFAIHDASVKPARQLVRSSSPLRVSSEEVSHFSSELYAHPKAVVENTIGHIHASPLLRVEQRESDTVDWAYRSTKDFGHHKHRSRSSSSTSRGRHHTRFSSGSDLMQLLPPEPIATANRDHVDHVLRPIIHRSRSRGRSRRRRRSTDSCRRRHRHHRSCRSDDTRSRSAHRHRHRHHRSSGFDSSLDEEELHIPGKSEGIRHYGEELHVRDAHHHTFSLRRNHRRQPVARNWRTGKKRICALIACANTAVLGIIIGIYASAPCVDWYYEF